MLQNRSSLGPTQPPIQWIPAFLRGGGWGGQKRPTREVDRSLASNAQVKNEWCYIAAPPVCLLGVDRTKCILM